MAVGEDEQLEQLDEFEARLLAQSVQQASKLLLREADQRLEHRVLLLVRLPLVEEWLVGELVEEGHGAEASPFEEEIEILVVIAVTLLWPLQILVTLLIYFAKWNFVLHLLNIVARLIRSEFNDLLGLLLLRCCWLFATLDLQVLLLIELLVGRLGDDAFCFLFLSWGLSIFILFAVLVVAIAPVADSLTKLAHLECDSSFLLMRWRLVYSRVSLVGDWVVAAANKWASIVDGFYGHFDIVCFCCGHASCPVCLVLLLHLLQGTMYTVLTSDFCNAIFLLIVLSNTCNVSCRGHWAQA